MNDSSKTSLAEAHRILTAPGQPFETQVLTIRGAAVTVWRHVPATAVDVLARVREPPAAA